MKSRAMTIAALLSACAAPGPADLTPQLTAEQYGNGMRVVASFQDGQDPVTSLDGTFKATFRGETKVLEHDFPAFWFTNFQIDAPLEREPITYDLTFDGEGTTSLTFYLTPITIDPVPLFVSRADNLTLSWSPAVDREVPWRTLACGSADGRIPANATTMTIPGASFGGLGTCTVLIELEQSQYRTVDDMYFAGLSFQFTQHPQVTFASTP